MEGGGFWCCLKKYVLVMEGVVLCFKKKITLRAFFT